MEVRIAFTALMVATISGCAHLEFESPDNGLAYYESIPYFFVSTTPECVTTVSVVMVPGKRRVVKFKSGFGSSELSVTLSNGMIASVGQKTDTKVPETITSIAALGTAAAAFKSDGGSKCEPKAALYPITNGSVDASNGPVLQVDPLQQ